jgi:hypothetical protein
MLIFIFFYYLGSFSLLILFQGWTRHVYIDVMLNDCSPLWLSLYSNKITLMELVFQEETKRVSFSIFWHVKDLCFALTIINGGIFIIELATYNDGLYIY